VTYPSPTPSSSRPLRIALIGAGRHAQHHARAILRCPGVQLVAVADPSDAAQAAMRDIVPGIGCFRTPEELFASERLDVVHIITPPASHAPLARMAIKAGCHLYVEKPFTESVEDAQLVLDEANAKGLRVCAGHQLLYEPPTRVLTQYLPSIGRVVHVESYFSFRTVRHAPGGRKVLRADHQLLDILPHPVYLLLQVLEQAGEGRTELLSLEVSQAGTVHALVRRGGVTGTLIVTLEGRPVESYLRVIGRNGSLFADYVRSTTQRAIGPGSSGIDKLFAPYRQAWQLLTGTTSAMAKPLSEASTELPRPCRTLFSILRVGSDRWSITPVARESAGNRSYLRARGEGTESGRGQSAGCGGPETGRESWRVGDGRNRILGEGDRSGIVIARAARSRGGTSRAVSLGAYPRN
jgi:predicted dehydrogenase